MFVSPVWLSPAEQALARATEAERAVRDRLKLLRAMECTAPCQLMNFTANVCLALLKARNRVYRAGLAVAPRYAGTADDVVLHVNNQM
jgi:hypothetical protein